MTTVIPVEAQQLLDRQLEIEKSLDEYSARLNKAPKGAMGLTLDSAKTPDWQRAKRLYSVYWKEYQRINQQLNKIRKAVGFEVVNGKRVTIYQYKTV